MVILNLMILNFNISEYGSDFTIKMSCKMRVCEKSCFGDHDMDVSKIEDFRHIITVKVSKVSNFHNLHVM